MFVEGSGPIILFAFVVGGLKWLIVSLEAREAVITRGVGWCPKIAAMCIFTFFKGYDSHLLVRALS